MEYKVVTFKVNTKLYTVLKIFKEVFALVLCTMLSFPLYFIANVIYNLF